MRKLLIFVAATILLLGLFACVDPATTDDDGETVHIHEYGDWVTTEPTCTAFGERTRSCECGNVQRETLSPKGHALVQVAAMAATCEKTGNTSYWYCANCKKKFSDRTAKTVLNDADVVLAKIDHVFSYHVAIEATCVRRGNIAYCDCLSCGKLFSYDENKTPLAPGRSISA